MALVWDHLHCILRPGVNGDDWYMDQSAGHASHGFDLDIGVQYHWSNAALVLDFKRPPDRPSPSNTYDKVGGFCAVTDDGWAGSVTAGMAVGLTGASVYLRVWPKNLGCHDPIDPRDIWEYMLPDKNPLCTGKGNGHIGIMINVARET